MPLVRPTARCLRVASSPADLPTVGSALRCSLRKSTHDVDIMMEQGRATLGHLASQVRQTTFSWTEPAGVRVLVLVLLLQLQLLLPLRSESHPAYALSRSALPAVANAIAVCCRVSRASIVKGPAATVPLLAAATAVTAVAAAAAFAAAS